MTSKDWKTEKARLSKVRPEERKNGYFCRDHCTPLSDVDTWTVYYQKLEKSRKEKVSEKDQEMVSNDSVEAADDATLSSDLILTGDVNLTDKSKLSSDVTSAKEATPPSKEASTGEVTPKKEAPSPNDMSWLSDKVSIYRGDITKLEIDAIVNAANNSLLGGGGLDGTIHRAAGGFLLAECKTLYGCGTGESKITSGYKLPAKNIIHTVGPVGEKSKLLKSCYQSSLELLKENNLKTIAFPCISTGIIYGYPSEKAAPVAIKTVKEFIKKNPDKVDRVIFCLFLDKDVEIYEKLMQEYFTVKT